MHMHETCLHVTGKVCLTESTKHGVAASRHMVTVHRIRPVWTAKRSTVG